jgi:hypothetical protein
MSDTNENFDELRRLLKMKRHEAPPPGYFNNFSSEVLARIREGEANPHKLLGRVEENSFLMNLLRLFQAKPGIIGGFATSLCLLLLIGVVMADRTDGVASNGGDGVQPVAMGNQGIASTVALLPADSGSGIALSTNRVSFQPSPALFGSQQNPLFQPAAFTSSGQ